MHSSYQGSPLYTTRIENSLESWEDEVDPWESPTVFEYFRVFEYFETVLTREKSRSTHFSVSVSLVLNTRRDFARNVPCGLVHVKMGTRYFIQTQKWIFSMTNLGFPIPVRWEDSSDRTVAIGARLRVIRRSTCWQVFRFARDQAFPENLFLNEGVLRSIGIVPGILHCSSPYCCTD